LVTQPPEVTQLPDVTQPPADYVPTAADAARAAAEEIKHLPSTAVQVDCAPGVPKFPIYTTTSGGFSRQRRYILADGRCFQDSVVRDLPIEEILPEVPSADLGPRLAVKRLTLVLAVTIWEPWSRV
jgi:hypothetical protein